VERKLAAILCADVHGYSRLMREAEEATLHSLSASRKIIDGLIDQHRGRFVGSAGDSVIAEFASVVNAVQCAVEIQSALKLENENVPAERRMEFRIGINLGDVMVEGDQIYGDGVNIAARLESIAEPGGICISDTVLTQIKSKLALGYTDIGEQRVKNIAEPIRVFRITTEARVSAPARLDDARARKFVRRGAFSLAGATIVIGTIALVQHLSLRPPAPSASIPPASPLALSLPNKPSIAVLPFTNMSGDPQQDYFSDGITNDLTTDLSRLPELFVIAPSSAFTYKGKAVKVQDVGRQLGVQYVLEGTVRRAAGKVRITVQLADAATGADLWAERYDRPLGDIFSVQDEIVRKIVTTTNLQLIVLEHGIKLDRRPDSLEAYDDYLQGFAYAFSNPTKENNEKARQLFLKAIALDPKFPNAYTGMAHTYLVDGLEGWAPNPEAWDRAVQWAQHALALDPSFAGGYGILSGIYLFRRQSDQSVAAAERALALEPNSALRYSQLANALSFSGKPLKAIAMTEKARRLDPRNQASYLIVEAGAYMMLGRYEEAVSALKGFLAGRSSGELDTIAHLSLAISYVEIDREADARAEAGEVLRINPRFTLGDPKQSPFQPALAERYDADLRKAGLK